MPRVDAGKPSKKIKKKPKYTIPKTHKPEATARTEKVKAGPTRPQATGKIRRPAPKRQPGPVSAKERRKVERHRETPGYQEALRRARVKGPGGRRGSKRPGGDDKSDSEFRKGQEYVRRQYIRKYGEEALSDDVGFYKRGTTVPPDVRARTTPRRLKSQDLERGEMVAPVLKALEQTTRPLHAVASAERAIIKGVKSGTINPRKGKFDVKEVGEAAVKGAKNEDKSTYSDVLGDLGVPKGPVRSTLGFAGDVLGDPLTYVTAGTGSVLRKAALDAAKRAEKKALKAGLSKAQAERMGHRAARQAERKGKDSRGVTVRVAGKELPGVRRVTAKAGRGAKKATDKPKIVRRAKEKVRHLAADVNPSITPDNITREGYREVRRATRTARSSTAREIAKTKLRAANIRKTVGKADQEILDAIESGTLRKLSPEKRAIAKRLQDQFKYARRLERRAGIPVKERKGYVPHALKDPEAAGKKPVKSVGAKKIAPTFAKARKEQRTLKELREEAPGRYQEDTAVLYANRMIESHIASNKAKLNRRLLDMGQRVRKGDEIVPAELAAQGQKVFQVKGSDIREIDLKTAEGKRELQRLVDEGDTGRGGQYVVLNEQVVDRAVKNVIPTADRTAFGEAFDKVQGGWKWLATVPNVGFHVRNLVGDAQNAFLAESAPRLAANTIRSGRTLRQISKQEEALRKKPAGIPAELKGKGVKVAGKKVSYEDLIKEAESVGAVRAGFINREIPELVKAGTGVKKIRKGARPVRSLSRFIQNREDLFRLATYIGSRNRGLSPEKAAERASKFHFDYADLTQLERNVLRRVAPFYTFSARNIPLQLTSYFTKPGKFSQYQKVREEFAKAFGVDLDEHEKNLTEYEQRSAAVPVKWKGHEFTLSFGPSGLPLTDLNELPLGSDPAAAADEWFQRATSLLSPAIKSPLEYGMNYSFFFRDQLERDEGPLVAAPSFVGKFPKSARDKLGIYPDFVDKRTGKKGWGWPAKADYIASQLSPGPLGLIKRVSTKSDRPGKSTTDKLVAGAGVRVTPVEPESAKIGRLFDEKAKLTKKRAAMNQRGINAEKPTPEWRKVSDQIKAIEAETNRLRAKRGDKIVPKRGRPRLKSSIDWGDTGGNITWPDEGSSIEWPD